jgi:hypothetical protein
MVMKTRKMRVTMNQTCPYVNATIDPGHRPTPLREIINYKLIAGKRAESEKDSHLICSVLVAKVKRACICLVCARERNCCSR